MKTFAGVLLLLLASLTVPPASPAQTALRVGPRIGVPMGDLSTNGGQFFVGADVRLALPGLRLIPNIAADYYVYDAPAELEASAFTLDLNVLYPFGINNRLFTPYAGVGLGLTRRALDPGPQTTEPGLNLLGGLVFRGGLVDPFAQLNLTIGGAIERIGLTAGLLFRL